LTMGTSSMASEFAQGCADALGFQEVPHCFDNAESSALEFYKAEQDYKAGGLINKAKAIYHGGVGFKDFLSCLKPCIGTVQNALKYKALITELKDPRFYSIHNALTLFFNALEERGEFEKFANDWEAKKYYNAGNSFTNALFDVIGQPGIPSSGPPAVNFALGFVSGFVPDLNFNCFHNIKVELPAASGGIFDLVTHHYAAGLASIFKALQSAVPTFKTCLKDAKTFIHLLKLYHDFKNPEDLAEIVAGNIEDNAIDITLQTGSAVVAFQGGEWKHFGKHIGDILEMVVVGVKALTIEVVV